ncbi:class F sortase [Planococcus halotolerans]|uniref:class F sortase n=1 Tax=Planococcus halotolerans TaxID=2233542 RepID=UPI001092AB46|nr:class F sortase [Planococcus halotolerans]QHJ71342.1 sortase [Planococcus halotolerans]
MNSFIKKAGLVYILFLFTTLSGNPIQATDATQVAPEIEFEKMEQRFPQEVVWQEDTLEEEILRKVASFSSSSKAENESTAEKKIGVVPALIEIPAIKAQAKVIPVGQTADGNMEAPKSIYEIGWYEPGTKPGGSGNAVLAGHVDGLSQPGTFYNLKKLEPGDEIHITGTEGKKLTFKVKGKASYSPEDAPIQEIFGNSSESHLNLITCTGVFDDQTGHYEERLVVFTELVEN